MATNQSQHLQIHKDNSEYFLSVKDDTLTLLRSIFSSDTPLVKSQFFELFKSSRMNTGEVKLWLHVLIQTIEDWLNFKKHPMSDSYKKLIRDVDKWAFKKSFTMDRICEAMDEAFSMDPEVFTHKFRKWLNNNRAVDLTKKFHVEEPFEIYNQELEFKENKDDGIKDF